MAALVSDPMASRPRVRFPASAVGAALLLLIGGCGATAAGDDPAKGAMSTAAEAPVDARTIASCREAALGHGDDRWRRRSATAGPFGLYGPGRDFRDHRVVVRHNNGYLGVKIPAFVAGTRAVTVSVPERFQDRVGLDFGDLRTESRISATNAEVIFEPCRGRPRTAWPGGLVLSDRRPVVLTVQVQGRERLRALRVGRG